MIDLHTHSTASDGTDSPATVVERAVGIGLAAVALTDHDTLAGLAEAQSAARREGIRLVPGCELSCQVDRGTLHLIVLFLDDGPGALQDHLARLRAGRRVRNVEIVDRLRGLGFDVTMADVDARAAGSVGRPHVAAVLVEKGHAASMEEAFERWLARGRPAYVERERLTADVAIELAHASGAVAVLAHPRSLDREPRDLDTFVASLAEIGLDGIEAEYGHYPAELRATLRSLADRHGLSPSGGSDYHGSHKPGIELGRGGGSLAVPDEWLTDLESRRPRASESR